jgi:hypothetical protein
MNLSEYLKSLGNTSAEVAESMRQQGIKGIRQSKCKCPILNAIYKAYPNYWTGLAIVNGKKHNDHWSYYATLNDCQIMDPSLPQPVMDFIGDFDYVAYPDLEAKEVKEVVTRVWE